jgi:hypothetical protein
MSIHLLADHRRSRTCSSMPFGIDVRFAVEAPREPECARFLQSWRIGGNRADSWPGKALAPVEALSLLPQTFVIERTGQGWRYKLFGAGLVGQLGVDLTGRLVRDVFAPAAADAMTHLFQGVAWRRAPVAIVGHWSDANGLEREFECVHAPLTGHDRCVSALLGCLSVREPRRAA